jgi:hypothetical protein
MIYKLNYSEQFLSRKSTTRMVMRIKLLKEAFWKDAMMNFYWLLKTGKCQLVNSFNNSEHELQVYDELHRSIAVTKL